MTQVFKGLLDRKEILELPVTKATLAHRDSRGLKVTLVFRA